MAVGEGHDQQRNAVEMAPRRTRKTVTVFALVAIVAGMGGLTDAAVPLYRLFCQVTGFGGTTQVAVAAPGPVTDRVITVRFNADTAGGVPWRFRPLQREMRVRLGEVAIAYYEAENISDQTAAGTATFNVTPFKTGRYFSKVQCFCFTEQTLAPAARQKMAVTFVVDPAMSSDPNVADVNTITLSYTFFPVQADDHAQLVAQGRAPDRPAP